MPLTKEQHLDPAQTPKRILALDGGGIRGILALEYLGAIEDMLKARAARYNALLEKAWLSTEVQVDYASDKLAKIAEMDDPSNMDELVKIGALAAAKQVKAEHFPARFAVR
jgi:hypothetical protein